VRAAVPEARLTIVGGAPPPEILTLAGTAVEVTGGVPDVTPYLDRAAVVAAPIRTGGGMRVKVLEALAAGKAVVASPVAVYGIDIEPGVHLEVAPDGDAFSRAVAALLRDESRRRSLGEAARRWATEHLGWERPIAAYEALYDDLLAR
jgi:glycosyltransferase involved in cell wall biosynthesis